MAEYNIAGFRDTRGRQVDLEGGGLFLNQESQTHYRGPLSRIHEVDPAVRETALRELERVVITIGEGEDRQYITLYSDEGFSDRELRDLTDYYAEIYG